ncbi:hypothetical protein HID58_032966, partial [Brassica napus]
MNLLISGHGHTNHTCSHLDVVHLQIAVKIHEFPGCRMIRDVILIEPDDNTNVAKPRWLTEDKSTNVDKSRWSIEDKLENN